jgi:hypothetical protein
LFPNILSYGQKKLCIGNKKLVKESEYGLGCVLGRMDFFQGNQAANGSTLLKRFMILIIERYLFGRF